MTMAELHLITGGQRSGKSSFAQKTALCLTQVPVYLATAQIWDDDFKDRINRHKAERGDNWENLEIPVYISQADVEGKVVLLDCITLWLTNIFFKHKNLTIDEILGLAKQEFNKLLEQNAYFIVVTNEIGLGGHGENEVARKFTDLQGWMNQYIASLANEVTLMISGIPLKIK
jgi:adenosylcobinamide kinase/adenosylcobinamide-phosphate guanylyltransferase